MKMKLLSRDISWLSFNNRVLDEADKDIPMQERYLFYGITGSNLDEYLMTRYPANLDFVQTDEERNEFKQAIISHYKLIDKRFQGFCKERDLLVPYREIHDGGLKNKLKGYFRRNIYPTLQPVTFDPTSKISPRTGLVIFVETADKENVFYNYVEIPNGLPRWLSVSDVERYIPIEDVIMDNLEYIFKGMTINRAFVFRVLRSAEVYLKGDYQNPYAYIEKTLKERLKSWITIVEIACTDDELGGYIKILRNILKLSSDTLILHGKYIKISDMKQMKIHALGPEEAPRKFTPANPFPETDVFGFIKEHDRLVFHPYESYQDTFVKFISEAADDPNVISIKISLYRVAEESKIVEALIHAAETGKKVTALVELKARFDESHNLKISKILQEAGVNLVYGQIDLKTHAKVCLVTRMEKKGVRVYTHIGTGNYNESNAKQYTDYSYFTANADLGYDVTRFFNLLTSEQEEFKSRKILYAPKNLRQGITDMIEEQIKRAKKKEKAVIVFKCNSLTDDKIAEMLVNASRAGVKITLIVRGACVLEPKKNIEIYSIVDFHLEHSRIYQFGPANNCRVFIGSNDIMHRNLNVRNELMVSIDDKDLKARILKHLDMYMRDTVGRRRILPNYEYEDVIGPKSYECQKEFYKEAWKNASKQ